MLKRWMRRVLDWENFSAFLQQEIRLFVFLLFVFCLFRVWFVVWMRDYIGAAAAAEDFSAAFLCGLKLSLKSAGALTAVSAAVGAVFFLFLPRRAAAARHLVGGLFIAALTLLFCGRIPYYAQFHSGYNQLIFNALNDDVYALTASLIEQFDLPLRLLGALALAAALQLLLARFLRLPPLRLPRRRPRAANWLLRGAFLALLYQALLFVRFGGGLTYASDVGWENAGVTKDQLLNEAILDDVQALCRAYELNGRMESSTGLAFGPEDIRGCAETLTGRRLSGDSLDAYLERRSGGAARRPRQIFLILSESYANWPLLDKYAALHLADGMRRVIARPDSAYADTFLPNGMSTISAVMGLVTGLADANLYLTTMPEAYEMPYATALAPQLERLGYRTRFWYAGPASWERIRDFTLAQGFAAFYGRGDYAGAAGNVWGCDDEFLYRAVLDGVDAAEPSFHFVLNTSNHSPYTVDLDRAGFDAARLAAALPESARGDAALIRQLGHHWYADRCLAAFIEAARRKCPDSLFVVVGDHADRVNIDKTPSLYERYGVPLILTGVGVTKRSLPAAATGSHIDVPPTLLELVAPPDFAYCAVGKSLTLGNRFGVNYGFWTADGYIGRADVAFAPEPVKPGRPVPDAAALQSHIEAVRCVSWWRGKYGGKLAE